MELLECPAKAKLRKARIHLLANKPFFGVLAMHMPMIESESAGGRGTTMVDEKGRFYYNKKWIMDMTPQDAMFELAHEVMHIVQQCISRFPKGGNHAIWNMAADQVVDTLLVDAGFAQSEISKKMVPEPIRKQVKGMTTEQVYYKLLKEEAKNPQSGNQGKGKGGQGKGKGNMQPGEGDQGPAVPDNHHHKNNVRGCTSASTMEKKITAETIEKFKQHIIAAAQVQKSRGDVPGFVQAFLAEIGKPTITWKDKLRNLTASYFKGRYTFMRPNRRSGSVGMRLPNRAPKKEGAIIMIDTSGSISDKEINQFVSEVVGIMSYCGCPWIKIYLHDVECYHSEKYSRSTIVKLPVTRGGTSHVDVFDKVLDSDDKIGCIVAFTDLYTQFPNRHVKYPVIWAHPESGEGQGVPFGTKVLIKLDEED
jgi:predicted metal-dependent peptidase